MNSYDEDSQSALQGQRSILRRGRNNDSVLSGSLSSCEELEGVGGPENPPGELERRLVAVEKHMQTLREGSAEDKGQVIKWKLEMEKRLMVRH